MDGADDREKKAEGGKEEVAEEGRPHVANKMM